MTRRPQDPGRVARLSGKLRRDGAAATVRAAAATLVGRVLLRERHVWLLLDLSADRPRPAPVPGLRVVQVPAGDVAVVARLGVSVPSARQRAQRGHQLFATLDGDRPVGVVWAFFDEAPTVVVRSGWLPLPAGHVNVEDMVVAPELRGRGVGPVLYDAAFDALLGQGWTHVVGKIPVTNAANRRACAKMGWPEVAVVDLLAVLGRRRVRVQQLAGGTDLPWLTAAETRSRR